MVHSLILFRHNLNEFLILVHGSYHISLSIFQIDVPPDTGNVEMKQQAFEAVSKGVNTYFNGSM